MNIKNTQKQKEIESPDNLFIREFFISFDDTIRTTIQSILDLYQDKWSVRLILLSFYFLEEKANEISINDVRDFAYGNSENPGLVQKFRMQNWSCFGGIKDEELVRFKKLITGSKHARNIPKSLCDEGLLMQPVGKNKELTPLGLSVCKYLHFKFLQENELSLKVLSDFYRGSDQSNIINEIPDSLPDKLDWRDCVNMGILNPINEENLNFKLVPKVLTLYEFILDHPYIDFRSSQILKKEIIKTIHGSIFDKVVIYAKDSPLIKEVLPSINKTQDITWIYKLDLRSYKAEENFKKWISSLFSNQRNQKFNGFILQLEPGTGKTIWMLQQTCELFLGNYKEPSFEEFKNDDNKLNVIPLFLPLKNFTIREINDKHEIFYLDTRLIEINEELKNLQNIREFWSKLIGLIYKGRELELWGRMFLRLFNESNILVLGDGWDELTPNFKKFFTELLLVTIERTNINLKYIISTRYLEKSLTSLIKEKQREKNIIKLEKPTKEQILKYLEEIEVKWISDKNSQKIIEKRFGDNLTPMNLWLLGLFPNFENLPKNRAELYERWIKYEALREISDKLNKKFGKTFLITIRGIRSYKDLDSLLDEQLVREIDGREFPLMQYLEGPIPGIIENSKIKKPADYGLLRLLPKLVYNRLSNPQYYENYHQIVQMNPLFNRFIRYYNDEKNRPNFMLINSHYDYYLAALHCFHTYVDGLTFDFLEDIDRKKGIAPELIESDISQSTSSTLIKSLFMEILDITNERRDNDIIQNISKELILLRNIYDKVPRFNDNAIGYPLNQNGPFIFKLKIRNFIDQHSKQVYKSYWNRYKEQKGVLPSDEDLEKFWGINNGLVNNEKQLRQFFINILNFQGKYTTDSFKLGEIFDKITIKTPHLIPILIYAYDISQTENLSTDQLKKLEDSEFMEFPWIKLWVYRGILRNQPERIKELCIYALEHTKHYLLKFCALNIIWTLNKEIDDESFVLSIKLFKRVSNRYKEIIIFQWASHLLTKSQLASIKNLEQNSHYGKKISRKVIFDLQYLLILHKTLPEHLEFHLDLRDIPRKKVLFFLIDLCCSKLLSEEAIEKIFINEIPLNSLIYIHRILLNELNSFSYDEIRQKITPEFKELGLKRCERWWKKNTPYKQEDIDKMVEEMSYNFLKRGTYKENKEFENQKFRLKKHLENLIDLPESEKRFVFSKGKELLENLLKQEPEPSPKYSFQSLTHVQDFYKIFYTWLIDWGNKEVLMEFYYEFKDYLDFDDFFFRAKNRIDKEKFGEFSSLILQNIKKEPKKYFLSSVFNSRRLTHHELVSKNSFLNNEKFKLLKLLSEDNIQELLFNSFDLSNNDDLFNYVYNLCNLGTDSALKKVAQLWDEYYVEINRITYNINKNAYDDPSFYIWCGIPYELLDKIYPFLQDPIAKIFYLVCLSIQDKFKPKELNEKHSINNDSSDIILLLKKFPQNDLEDAIFKFLSADWNIYHFQFLFSFVSLTEKLIKCMIDNTKSARRSLSSILSIKCKKDIKGEENFLSFFFEICPELAINFCYEVMTYYDQRDKVALFSELIRSNNPKAFSLAAEFWEKYDNLVQDLSNLNFEEIETRILNTNNFKYIKNLKQAFRPDIRKIKQIKELKELKQNISRLEKLIQSKMNNVSIKYFDESDYRYFERTFDYIKEEIKEKKIGLKASQLDLEDYLKFLNNCEEKFLTRIIDSRFPSIYYHKREKSMIWREIDDLNWIKSQNLKRDKVKELIDKKIEVYQRSKEEILKYPDRFNETIDHFKFSENRLLESPFLKELIINEVQINFKKFRNIDSFLSELKTIKAKQRALFYLLSSYFPNKGYNTPRETIVKEKYEEIKENIMSLFEKYLNYEEMKIIFESFEAKIKANDAILISREKTISYEDETFYDKEFNEKLNKAKERIYSELLAESINVSEIENNLKFLGDGFEFRQFISLLMEQEKPEYFYGKYERMYEKIPLKNRKKLQKYLFYWILKQRQIYQNNLSHDSIAVADESNEIYDVDQGISIDNLFEEVFINSLDYGYFPTTLNYLKETEQKDWYKIIKSYTLFQLEPGIKDISSVQYQYRSRLKIPINHVITAFEEEEIKQSMLLYSATHFYNVVNIQLFDLPQFLNGFKLRETTKHREYDDY